MNFAEEMANGCGYSRTVRIDNVDEMKRMTESAPFNRLYTLNFYFNSDDRCNSFCWSVRPTFRLD